MIRITGNITLDEREIDEKFIRASGPGGQNVNKVATAVQLRFNVLQSQNIPREVKVRLISLAGSRATNEGEILIEADRYRTREQNRADALERLVDLVREAAVKKKPRRKTKPTRASVKRRVEAKKKRGEVKRSRGKVNKNEY